jgi:hypothetical protein
VTSFRELIKTVSPEYEWVGTLGFAAGLSYVVVTLVSSGLEAGAVIATDHPIDPTITVNGTYILYGSMGRMLLGLFLATVGYAITRTGMLTRAVLVGPVQRQVGDAEFGVPAGQITVGLEGVRPGLVRISGAQQRPYFAPLRRARRGEPRKLGPYGVEAGDARPGSAHGDPRLGVPGGQPHAPRARARDHERHAGPLHEVSTAAAARVV